MKALRRRPVGVMAILLIILTQGCYTYRLNAPNHPGVKDEGETVWSFAWGLVHERPRVNCHGQALAEVTVKSNLAYDILTVATLGFASPKKVTWKCARAAGQVATVTIPADSTVTMPAASIVMIPGFTITSWITLIEAIQAEMKTVMTTPADSTGGN